MNIRLARNIGDICSVTGILHGCGKDMAQKYDLHHWDNPWLKTFLIVLISFPKNKVYVVEQDEIIATYQTNTENKVLYFEKLAVNPKEEHKGIGSFCLFQIEKEAKEHSCEKVQLNVYSKSRHAIQFYEKHGYTRVSEEKTLKYDVICLEKVLA